MSSIRVAVADSSAVGEARRAANTLAGACGFNPTEAGRVAIVATELATNLIKHAGGGEMLLQRGDERLALDLIALDRGPGIANLATALRDGHSSSGSPGTGLGAITRLSSFVDVYTQRDAGTALLARFRSPGVKARDGFGAINVPHPHEVVSGDTCSVRRAGASLWALVADGLGHGPIAADAARAAREAFELGPLVAPAEILERIHLALRPTRGAAVAVAQIERNAASLHFAGLGNVSGTIVTGGLTRSLVSHHGTAGHDAVRIREFAYPWTPGASLLLHSDGISARWSPERYAGLFTRHPLLVAAVLYRDHRRGADDASMLVIREEA